MTTDQIITLIVALGGGAFLREIAVGVYRWLTGGQSREQTALRQALAEVDAEAAHRRRVTEHAHELRRMLIDQGVPTEDIPAFPARIPLPPPEES